MRCTQRAVVSASSATAPTVEFHSDPPPERDNHQALVDRLRRGDRQSLAALMGRHRDRLRKIIEFRLDMRLRGRVSASDVLQEAYIDALKRLPHFIKDPDVPFFVWLRTVTIQRLIQFHRQHLMAQARDAKREHSLGGAKGTGVSTDGMAALIGDFTSPSQSVQRVETRMRVRAALDRLQPGDREVLALRHFEELSNREVAALLGIEPAAASKRYVRAIERLRHLLETETLCIEGRS